MNRLKEFLYSVAFALLLVASFNQVFAIITIDGISMASTLKDDTMHLSLRKDFVGTFEKGDVIFFEAKLGDEKIHLIKRIIATEGDTLTIKDNTVYVNDVLVEEIYINGPMTNSPDMEITIGEDEYFVMGDNRDYSIDSREIGPIPKSAIRGKLVL